MKFKVGDNVTWDGSPNERSFNRSGVIRKIRNNIAFIENSILGDKIRKVSIKILKKQ